MDIIFDSIKKIHRLKLHKNCQTWKSSVTHFISIIINTLNVENNAYPDKEGDFDPDRDRDLDFDWDLAGERREDLAFGDLLHYIYKDSI